jgi:hypothetical protein
LRLRVLHRRVHGSDRDDLPFSVSLSLPRGIFPCSLCLLALARSFSFGGRVSRGKCPGYWGQVVSLCRGYANRQIATCGVSVLYSPPISPFFYKLKLQPDFLIRRNCVSI